MTLDKNELKHQIIGIADRLIRKGGTGALQMRTIAKEAGISVGSVYNIIGDVDALQSHVNMRLLDELGAAGLATTERLQKDGVTDVRQRLIALAETYLAFVARNQRRWNALLAYNRSQATADLPRWYVMRQEMLFDIIATVLEDTPLKDDDARRQTAARALWSSVHGIVTNSFIGRKSTTHGAESRAQIELLVSVFVTGLEAGG